MTTFFSRRFRRLLWIVPLLAVAACLGVAGMYRSPPAIALGRPLGPAVIVARGRVEAASRLHVVSGPSGAGTISELRVAEGQLLSRGEVVAVLDQNTRRQAELQGARLSLELAKQELERFSTGGRPEELKSRSARLGIAAAELAQQQRQAERGKVLGQERIVSREQVETLTTNVERGQHTLAQAKADLEWARLNFASDLRIAALHVQQETTAVDRAAAELEATIVRAPITGTVLTISGRAGSAIGVDGIMTMADLSNLVVIAEVAADDATMVGVGNAATIAGLSGGQRWSGRVSYVQRRVFSTQRPSSDVLTGRDARVVEAEIVVDPPGGIPSFIDAEVVVSIQPAAP